MRLLVQSYKVRSVKDDIIDLFQIMSLNKRKLLTAKKPYSGNGNGFFRDVSESHKFQML